jgi:hypothetical protein
MRLAVKSGPRAAVHRSARPRFGSGLRRWGAAAWEELAPGRVLPADVRTELGLERGERVLSADRERNGESALVATDRALYHRDRCGGQDGGWSRLGWEQVARVDWDTATRQLVVTGVARPAGAAPDAAAPRVVVPLRRRGSVPDLALERVTHTRLGQWQLLAGGRRRAVIEARRRPGTGELLWSLTCDEDGVGDGPADQVTRAQVVRAIARLSAEFGAAPAGNDLLAFHGAGNATWRLPSGGRAAAAE